MESQVRLGNYRKYDSALHFILLLVERSQDEFLQCLPNSEDIFKFSTEQPNAKRTAVGPFLLNTLIARPDVIALLRNPTTLVSLLVVLDSVFSDSQTFCFLSFMVFSDLSLFSG